MTPFTHVVESVEELRQLVGTPASRSVLKERKELDHHDRAFIALSPFVLLATSGDGGRCDVSPKGDAPGFVKVLDSHRLVIPDRPGNKRMDGMANLLTNPHVGLIFLIPGRQETLRVNGRAVIVRDRWLRERMAVDGRTPELALVVTVEQAFVHCGKCMIRSRLWEPQSWSPLAAMPSHARCLIDQAKPAESLEEIEASVLESYRTRLY